jgi:hypothetical protein
MITFDAGPHTYTRNGSRYLSVTQLINRYCPPFDTEYWSLYKAIKDVLTMVNRFDEYKAYCKGWKNCVSKFKEKGFKDKNLEYKVIQRQNYYIQLWSENTRLACERGSSIHDSLEGAINHAREVLFDRTPLRVYEGEKNRQIPPLGQTGIYTEMYLWSDEHKVAGKSDVVLIPKYGRVRIKDYKTNKKLSDEAFDNQTFLGPLSHIPYTKIHTYTLQLSIYGYMMERWGFRVEDLEIIHITDDAEPKSINLYYYKDEAKALLDHYKSGQQPGTVVKKDFVGDLEGKRIFRFN